MPAPPSSKIKEKFPLEVTDRGVTVKIYRGHSYDFENRLIGLVKGSPEAFKEAGGVEEVVCA